jgi:hypothetical protein
VELKILVRVQPSVLVVIFRWEKNMEDQEMYMSEEISALQEENDSLKTKIE